MFEKRKNKQNKQAKDKCLEKEVMGGFFQVYSDKGQGDLLYMWTEVRGKWLPRWAFHSEERGWSKSLLSRGQCSRMLLQLQYKFRRKFMGIRTKTRTGESKRTLRPKAKVNQSKRKLVSGKN